MLRGTFRRGSPGRKVLGSALPSSQGDEHLSPFRELLARGPFRTFLTAGAASFAAPTSSLVVLLWTIATAYPDTGAGHTAAAYALAFLGLSSTIPTLAAAVFSGTLADRADRRRLMQEVNLLALFATAAIAFVLYLRPGGVVVGGGGFYAPVWVLATFPLWAVETTAVTIFRPTFNSSLPRLVGRAELGSANGLVYASAVGVLVAGSLTTSAALGWVGPAPALLLPIALFALTTVALAVLRADLAPRRERPPRRFLSEAADGYRYLFRRRELLEITLSALVVNFFSAVAFVELALYVQVGLALSNAVFVGAMLSAGSLGSAVGTLVINRWRFEARAGRFLAAFTLLQGLSVVGLGLVHSPWLALPIMFLFGVFPGMFTTVFLATIQATVPEDRLGRVLAADEVGSYGLVPFGQYAGGVLTAATSVDATYLVAGAGTVAIGGLMAALPHLRRLGFTPTDEGASAPSEGPGATPVADGPSP